MTTQPHHFGVPDGPLYDGVPDPVDMAKPPLATGPSDPPHGPRLITTLWGFVVLVIGLGLVALSSGADIDYGLAAIVLLTVAGVTLVLGSILSSTRRRKRP